MADSDSYKTPEWILTMFKGWFDPCPLNPNPTQDGHMVFAGQGTEDQEVSGGHTALYRFFGESHFRGKIIDTSVRLVGYEAKKK